MLRLTRAAERVAGEAHAALARDIDAITSGLSDKAFSVVANFLQAVAEVAEQRADELARQASEERPPGSGRPVPELWG